MVEDDANAMPTLGLYCRNTRCYLPTRSWVQYYVDEHPLQKKVGLYLFSVGGTATIRCAQQLSDRPDLKMSVAQMTTPDDSRVIANNSPTEVVLCNIIHHVLPDAVLEFAFVLGTQFLVDNPQFCIASISNAYLIRFQKLGTTEPLTRVDSETNAGPLPFVSCAHDLLYDDTPRMLFDALTHIQETMRAILRSQGASQANLAYKRTRNMYVPPFFWDYITRRLTNEEESITLNSDVSSCCVATQHYGVNRSKVRVQNSPKQWLAIISREQVRAFERTFGCSVTIGISGRCPTVKAGSKRPIENDIVNLIDPEEDVDYEEAVLGPRRISAGTHCIVLSYQRCQLSIFVCYGREVLTLSAEGGSEGQNRLIKLLTEHGCVINVHSTSEPLDENIQDIDVVENASFYWAGKLQTVTLVEGSRVEAVAVDMTRSRSVQRRTAQQVCNDENGKKRVRQAIIDYYRNMTT